MDEAPDGQRPDMDASADAAPCQTRHRLHSPEKCLFSMWIDIGHLARCRARARSLGMTVTELFVKSVGPLELVELKPDDAEWIERRRERGKTRRC